MQTVSFKHRLRGDLAGPIWSGQLCTKPFERDLDQNQSLRDAIAAVCKDGDFQSAKVTADTLVVTTATIRRGSRVYTREEYRPVEHFPSVSDLIAY